LPRCRPLAIVPPRSAHSGQACAYSAKVGTGFATRIRTDLNLEHFLRQTGSHFA
jgi:hypothetical protein